MIGALFNHRTRGFRTINLVGMAALIVMALTVNLAKTYAGRERSQIDRIDRQIAAEQVRIRLLQAEVAHLEQPNRLEKLSRETLGMAPTTAKQEVSAATLAQVVRPAEPIRMATALVAPAPAADAEKPAEPAKPEPAKPEPAKPAPAKDAPPKVAAQ
jgi:cell division protein FtsL